MLKVKLKLESDAGSETPYSEDQTEDKNNHAIGVGILINAKHVHNNLRVHYISDRMT